MEMKQIIFLRYSGGRGDSGEMDSYEVAEAIRGFSDFTRRISDVLYKGEAEIRSVIRGFETGSFEIQFLYELFTTESGGLIASALGSPADILRLIGECIGLIKHLKGEPPKSVRHVKNEGVYVENNSGEINTYNNLTVNLVTKGETSRDAQKFVRAPLRKSAEIIEIVVNDNAIGSVNRDESEFFVPINADDVLTEHVSDVYLEVHTAVFEGKGKWRFIDGKRIFVADIHDTDFLTRLDEGQERFGKGDFLYVRLRSIQRKSKGKLQTDFIIEKIIEHLRRSDAQHKLFRD